MKIEDKFSAENVIKLITFLKQEINFTDLLVNVNKTNCVNLVGKENIENIKVIIAYIFKLYKSKKILFNIPNLENINNKDYKFITIMKEIEKTEVFQILYDFYVEEMTGNELTNKYNLALSSIYPLVLFNSFKFFAIITPTFQFEKLL